MKSAAEVASQPVASEQADKPASEPRSSLPAVIPAPPVPPQQDRRGTLELFKMVSEAGLTNEFARGIIEAELARDSFNQDYRLATVFANSGVFADLKNTTELQGIATAMAKIQLGRSWGLTPADAMEFIYFTNGRPAIMNELIASKVREAGYDWDTQWHESNDVVIGCTLWLKKLDPATGKYEPVKDRQGKEVSASFTKADADRAMIHEKGALIPLSQKWNFKSWPREMYFWRCIGRLKKFYVTNVLRGAITVDEAQEMPQITDRAGHVAALDEGSRDMADAAGARKVEEFRAKGFKIQEIPAKAETETSTRQTATDDSGGQSSTDRPETSAQAESGTVEASQKETDKPAPETTLSTFQHSVAQYEESIGADFLRNVMGIHGCEDISQVNESNWKAIATACEDRLKEIRAAAPAGTAAAPKLQFGSKRK